MAEGTEDGDGLACGRKGVDVQGEGGDLLEQPTTVTSCARHTLTIWSRLRGLGVWLATADAFLIPHCVRW